MYTIHNLLPIYVNMPNEYKSYHDITVPCTSWWQPGTFVSIAGCVYHQPLGWGLTL